ncbi:MAG: SGNH/GDSL hydrolase family protein [Candidatus Binatia bacterium]
MQIGAAFVGARPENQLSWTGDKWQVLALGDSNTYGLHLDRSQAYPKLLETLWNTTSRNQHINVLNLGLPGMSSSKLAKDFHRMLWVFHPQLITVMIGANDFWTVPETAAESPDPAERMAAALWRVSRVYRLFYMLWRAAQEPADLQITAGPREGLRRRSWIARYGTYEFELGWKHVPEGGIPGWQPAADLTRNLETLAAQAKGAGTTLILLTYPSENGWYGPTNDIIRAAAKEAGIPVVDLGAAFRPICPEGRCPELFPDHHPTAVGHERVARILADRLMANAGAP